MSLEHRSEPPLGSVTHLDFVLPADQKLSGLRVNGTNVMAISPDGTKLVYVANDRLFIRSLSESSPKVLGDTTGAAFRRSHPTGSGSCSMLTAS